ncbi:hypothetical protein SDC9_195341 [bioreactor metagenome]|uniref:Uncharacterized protein n=1 Tax=bioreactor metagenome TaxID=1076179 RepID=A0A645I8R0_9ZZZZ
MLVKITRRHHARAVIIGADIGNTGNAVDDLDMPVAETPACLLKLVGREAWHAYRHYCRIGRGSQQARHRIDLAAFKSVSRQHLPEAEAEVQIEGDFHMLGRQQQAYRAAERPGRSAAENSAALFTVNQSGNLQLVDDFLDGGGADVEFRGQLGEAGQLPGKFALPDAVFQRFKDFCPRPRRFLFSDHF